ncbi:MAG: FecR domain-containing protein [Chitinispirillaceae bacterium]|nr:FecR domain-containing protein [Chitinispirillaceae bacterium]
MVKKIVTILIIAIACRFVFSQNSSKGIAAIQLIQGSAGLKKSTSDKELPARAGMTLRAGDTIQTHTESLVEIKFDNGEIVRLDENTVFCLDMNSSQKTASSLPAGRVWVNMKKLVKHREFDVATPTAIAAIRGTIYAMRAGDDQSVDMSVYDGKVDIGPSDKLKKELSVTRGNTIPGNGPAEMEGPTEIEGPREVTLEQWLTIVAGTNIKIAPGGAFVTSKIEKIETDTFVSKNLSFDRDMK